MAQGAGAFAPQTAAWPSCVGSVVVRLQLEGGGQLVSYLLVEGTCFSTE